MCQFFFKKEPEILSETVSIYAKKRLIDGGSEINKEACYQSAKVPAVGNHCTLYQLMRAQKLEANRFLSRYP